MLVSTRHKLAILAMPKTGTTALERALAPHCEIVIGGDPRLKHMPLRKFERFLRPLLESSGQCGIETMCLIREPVDWLASWYRYRRRNGVPDPRKSTAGISFEAFADAYLSDHPPPFAQVGRPARFVQAQDGRLGVDHLFRYEAFERATAFLSERLGQPLTVSPANVSRADPVDVPAHLRRRIEDGMAQDVQIWESAAR